MDLWVEWGIEHLHVLKIWYLSVTVIAMGDRTDISWVGLVVGVLWPPAICHCGRHSVCSSNPRSFILWIDSEPAHSDWLRQIQIETDGSFKISTQKFWIFPSYIHNTKFSLAAKYCHCTVHFRIVEVLLLVLMQSGIKEQCTTENGVIEIVIWKLQN